MYTTNDLAILATRGRRLAIQAVGKAASGHPGGSLSCIDALTQLYFEELNIRPEDPKWEDRDRFVLSKGHCAPALYAVLALRGFFPEEDMMKLRSIHYHYSGHPDMNHVPGVDMSTGSLGQGLSASVGMAIAARVLGKRYRTWAVCGDGEIEEGQVWEAFMAAAKYKLDNLCVMIDVNGLQIDGPTALVMPSEPLDKKLEAFNWHVIKVNGHSFEELRAAQREARETRGCPTVILMSTVKGKGVSYMENAPDWHGKAPGAELLKAAVEELDAQLHALYEIKKEENNG